MSAWSIFSLCTVLLACPALAETRRPVPTDIPAFELLPAGILQREGKGWSFEEVLVLPEGRPTVVASKGLYVLEVISARGRKQTVPAALETFSPTTPLRRFERELPPESLRLFWRSVPITVTPETQEFVFRAGGKVLKTLRRPAKPPRATRFTLERRTLRTGGPAILVDWELEEASEGVRFALRYRVRGDTWETWRTSDWPDTDFESGRRGVLVPAALPTELSDIELEVLLWDGFHLTRYHVGYVMAAAARSPEWKALVEGLDPLGFFAGLSPAEADQARRRAIADRGFHFVESLEGRRTLHLDQEDLVEGGVLATLERLREGLEERGVTLGKMTRVFNLQTGEHSVTINGRTYTIQSPEERGQLTALAPLARTMHLLDTLLEQAGSQERVFFRDCGAWAWWSRAISAAWPSPRTAPSRPGGPTRTSSRTC